MFAHDIVQAVAILLRTRGPIGDCERKYLGGVCERVMGDAGGGALDLFIAMSEMGPKGIHAMGPPEWQAQLIDELVKAAATDGFIHPRERAILNDIARRTQVPPDELEKRIQTSLARHHPAPPHIAAPPPTRDATPQSWTAGDSLLGEFDIERELGRGGMGQVVLVRRLGIAEPYAVKRALVQEEKARKLLIAELQTWIDLPEHPHLTACRFFRTLGDEILIFAEFVPGGSLTDWITGHKLKRLDAILDVAIQFAWGLHAAHVLGLVHQDVKPRNVLMSDDGTPKVADFGLARARSILPSGGVRHGQGPAVSMAGGFTPAYCSPEQASISAQRRAGVPDASIPHLTRATDAWSWGLSVLAMFMGEEAWQAGQAGAEVLESFVEAGGTEAPYPPLPPDVAQVLSRCLRRNPAERWATLMDASDALEEAYRRATGSPYPRAVPIVSKARRKPTVASVETAAVEPDTGPRGWLGRALTEAGRPATDAERLVPAKGGSGAAQVVEDLAVMEQAVLLYERLVAQGRADLEVTLAQVCEAKAEVHDQAGDARGTLAVLDRAIGVREGLVQHRGRQDLLESLAHDLVRRSIVLEATGDLDAADKGYGEAIRIRRRLAGEMGTQDADLILAGTYVDHALLLDVKGAFQEAAAEGTKGIEIYEGLQHESGPADDARSLANALVNRAVAWMHQMQFKKGEEDVRRSIDLLEGLVRKEESPRDLNELSRAYMELANALSIKGETLDEAIRLHERTVAIRRRLVEDLGHREFADRLARACMNQASALYRTERLNESLRAYDLAVETFGELVRKDGRGDLVGDLAFARVLRAQVIMRRGEVRRGQAEAKEAIALLRAEVERSGRSDLKKLLDVADRLPTEGEGILMKLASDLLKKPR